MLRKSVMAMNLVLLATITVNVALAQTNTSSGNFEIQKLADGIYAALRKHPPLMSFDPNNVFIRIDIRKFCTNEFNI